MFEIFFSGLTFVEVHCPPFIWGYTSNQLQLLAIRAIGQLYLTGPAVMVSAWLKVILAVPTGGSLHLALNSLLRASGEVCQLANYHVWMLACTSSLLTVTPHSFKWEFNSLHCSDGISQSSASPHCSQWCFGDFPSCFINITHKSNFRNDCF